MAYRALAKLGVGGMAEVYRAVLEGPHGAHKPCVVKRIAPQHLKDERFRQLFLDEARISMLLNHPNLVQAFELGEQDGAPYLALELVDGMSLSTLLVAMSRAHEIFPLNVALHVAGAVARGLAYAHRLTDLDGVPLLLTHRDVSPQNILLSRDGAVKLADFGIAVHELRDYETRGPSAKGKPGYMAPEQAMGARVDARADVFALGVVLTEMVSGARVGAQPTVDALMGRIVALSRAHPHANEALVALIAQLTAADRDRRVGTAEDAADRIEALARTVGPPGDVGALVRAHAGAIATMTPSPGASPAAATSATPVLSFAADLLPEEAVPSTLIMPPSSTMPPAPKRDGDGHWSDWLLAGRDVQFDTENYSVPLHLGREPSRASRPPADGFPLAPMGRGASVAPPIGAPAPAAPPVPIVSGSAIAAPPAPPAAAPRPRRPLPRGPLLLGGAGVLAVLVLVGAYALRPAPPPPAPATLTVTSTPPGARVFIDDADTGKTTPATFSELMLGRSVRVEVRGPGVLAEPRQRLVEPTAEARAVSAAFVLQPARVVRVESVPAGATARIGERTIGVTPFDTPPLAVAASATITLELEGYLAGKVVVQTGTRTLAHADLERAREIVLESTPDGAQAFVDNVAVGETPVMRLFVPADRPFQLRIERRGYTKWNRKVDLRRVRDAKYAATLTELPILALPLSSEDRQTARALLDERARLNRALVIAKSRLQAAKQELAKANSQRQRFVAVTAEAEAAVTEAEGAVEEARDALDRVEGELETLRDKASQ